MVFNSPGFPNENPVLQNTEKSLALASALFPHEEWIAHGENIFVAKSRLAGGHKEQAKLKREIDDVRILTGRGSVAYFLPETEKDESESEDNHNLRADTVMDGEVMELKRTGGNRETIGKFFRRGYKQGRSLLKKHGITADNSVFLRLFSNLSVESIRAKLAGELKGASDTGRCICYFEATG